MKTNVHVRKELLFRAYLLLFVIHTTQTGVGIIGLPRVVFLETEQDSWIVILLSGIVVSLSVAAIVMTMRQYSSADLYGIHVDIFKKWLGNLLNIIYIVYLIYMLNVIALNYTELVQAWIFQTLPNFILVSMLMALSVYGVLGGVRVVVGVCFIGFLLAFWIVFIIYTPMQNLSPLHFYPMVDHNAKEFFNGIIKVTLSILGFEVLFFIYPFIKDKEKVLKHSLLSIWFTTILFALVTAISIGFFAPEALKRIIWPVLSMFKIVKLPFLERFEFIAVSFWMLIILPNLCVYLWCASRGIKRVFGLKQTKATIIIALLSIASSNFIPSRIDMNMFTDYAARVGIVLAILYPILLYVIVKIVKSFRKRRNAS
ncbi:spore gernimation protein [Bacillus coahuilensis m2-6]|uniref:GerAB/ArcD/ProY family transporter n=1 Tax=Bacillus coahuilensis TaxID=408580 RepID=UPI000750542B|nr:GerAB/ArcD/ProY family transporter [Bacillus coahuilensis]KUP08136.1 spore gernimation protein [Bacillus coahuilensis m2-6]